MKLTHTPHRFYQFDNPKHAPFDDPATRRPTIVGKYFAPICQMKGVRAFGFLDHGDMDMELRLACRNYQVIEERTDACIWCRISRKQNLMCWSRCRTIRIPR